ncbi:alpha-(1-_3)-arabinofuranosyltransferase family protein [Streptomyces sp. M19]
MAWPYLNGTVLQPGGFRKLPAHWERTADWLREHSPTAARWWCPRPPTACTRGASRSTSRWTCSPGRPGRSATSCRSARRVRGARWTRWSGR